MDEKSFDRNMTFLTLFNLMLLIFLIYAFIYKVKWGPMKTLIFPWYYKPLVWVFIILTIFTLFIAFTVDPQKLEMKE